MTKAFLILSSFLLGQLLDCSRKPEKVGKFSYSGIMSSHDWSSERVGKAEPSFLLSQLLDCSKKSERVGKASFLLRRWKLPCGCDFHLERECRLKRGSLDEIHKSPCGQLRRDFGKKMSLLQFYPRLPPPSGGHGSITLALGDRLWLQQLLLLQMPTLSSSIILFLSGNEQQMSSLPHSSINAGATPRTSSA